LEEIIMLLKQVEIPEGECGIYRIERFTVTGREFQRPQDGYVLPGTYTKLMRGNTLVMSDTSDEMSDHYRFIKSANGNVLVAGLGIGMVLYNLLEKQEVSHIDVLELSKEVISLVGPWFIERYVGRINIIHANALEYTPPKGTRYDFAWFDIWDNITSDNLEDMKKLHRKYAKIAREKGSWARGMCEYYRSKEKLNRYW
jgi:spermidine synthase